MISHAVNSRMQRNSLSSFPLNPAPTPNRAKKGSKTPISQLIRFEILLWCSRDSIDLIEMRRVIVGVLEPQAISFSSKYLFKDKFIGCIQCEQHLLHNTPLRCFSRRGVLETAPSVRDGCAISGWQLRVPTDQHISSTITITSINLDSNLLQICMSLP
jgi:hypothetical protein